MSEVDTKTLQLFFLSLLWRAAASTRYEFAEVFLNAGPLEHLRKIVNGEVEPTAGDFPTVLVLMTTKRPPQVHTPLAQVIDMSLANSLVGSNSPDVPIFRFFLDGLIVHMGRRPQDQELLDGWSGRVVGQSDKLTLIGRPYAGSSQEARIYEHSKQSLRTCFLKKRGASSRL